MTVDRDLPRPTGERVDLPRPSDESTPGRQPSGHTQPPPIEQKARSAGRRGPVFAVLAALAMLAGIWILLRGPSNAPQAFDLEPAATSRAPNNGAVSDELLDSLSSTSSLKSPADTDEPATSAATQSLPAVQQVTVNSEIARAYVDRQVLIEVYACGGTSEIFGFDTGDYVVVDAAASAIAPVAAFVMDGSVLSRLGPVGSDGLLKLSRGPRDSRARLPVSSEYGAGTPLSTVSERGEVVSAVARSASQDTFEIEIEGGYVVTGGSPVFTQEGELVGVAAEGSRLGLVRVSATSGWGDASSTAGPLQPCDGRENSVRAETRGSWNDSTQQQTRSLLLAQYLANGFAHQDVALVRAYDIDRSRISQADLDSGWGALRRSTIIPVEHLSEDAETSLWRLGLVAHEQVGGSQLTKLFCVTWRIDLSRELVEQTGVGSTLLSERAGWVDPVELGLQAKDNC